MKRNIFFLILAVAMGLTASCQKVEDTYVPGKPTVENDNVYFSPDNSPSAVLPVDANEITVILARMDSTETLTVPVTAWTSCPEAFELPAVVEFAAGSSTAEYTFKVTDKLEMFVNYPVRLSVPEEMTNAYDTLDVYPRFALNVVKEDYKPYAKGVWVDYFLYAGDEPAQWEQLLQYSEILGLYRFPDVWWPGYSVEFEWDGTGNPTLAEAYATGYDHPTYGMITANTLDAKFAENTFEFNFEWTVSAGSFGAAPQFFAITEKF